MDQVAALVLGLSFASVIGFVAFILPIVSFLKGRRLSRELEEVRGALSRLDDEMGRVRAQIIRQNATATAAPVQQTPASVPVQRPLSAEPSGAAAQGQAESIPAIAPRPVETPAFKTVHAVAPAVAPVSSAARQPVARVPAAVPTAAEPERVADTLETKIGGVWLLYIGMGALLLGLGFFIKLAFDNDWINETTRVVAGGAIGILMVFGGLRLASRNYRLYGEIVAGGGFVAMYLSVYAAFNFYALITQPVAFGLMVAITAAAALAADRERSPGLASVAILGGFLTPFLVGRHEDAQVTLLTYDAILVAGTMYLARRRSWPLLNVASYILTALTFAGWAAAYYAPSKYVTTEVFLTLYCAMFLYMQKEARQSGSASADAVSTVLWSAPVVYHLASLNNLMPHSLPLLVYLTLATLVGVLASIRFDKAWLRLTIFGATVPIFLQWLARHTTPAWLLANVTVMLAIYALHLVAQGERLNRKGSEQWPLADLTLFHANGLALFFGAYLIVNSTAPTMTSALALGLAFWHLGLAWYFGALTGDAGPNSLALAFAMLGFAIGLQFDDWLAVVGWTAEAVAVVWVGILSRRDWMRIGGVLLLTGTIARLLSIGYFLPPSGFGAVFNARFGVSMVIVAALYALAYLHWRARSQFDDGASPEIATSILAANVMTLLLLSTEISFYWKVRAGEDAAADLAQQASLSVVWAIYGAALIIVGINRRYAPVRYLAIALLALTIGKVFLFDVSMLGTVYRIVGFVGLGLALLLGAWLYQRYRDIILGKD